MTLSLALCTALGLSAQATEAQAVSAINQMKTDKDKALNSTHNPSLEKFVPRADHDAALNRAQAAEIRLKEIEHRVLHQHIEDELEKAQKVGAITPDTVAYHRACCQQDGGLKRFREFVQCAPRMGEDTDLDKKAANQQSKGLSEEEKAACSFREKGSEANKEIRMFSNLTELSLSAIESLDLADYRKLQEAYQDFLS